MMIAIQPRDAGRAALSVLFLVLLHTGSVAAAARARSCPDADVPRIVKGPEAARMDRRLQRAADFGFSGQVIFARDHEVLLHRAYGFADRGGGRAMETETPIGIASISKRFTAAAVLALVEEKKLRLEGAVGEYLDGVPADKAGVTLHQILTHSAGLSGADAGDDFEIENRADLLKRIFAQPRRAGAGERWIYSNSGYSLLAAVVEETAGVPYETFVRDRFFSKAGMTHSGFWHEPRESDPPAAVAYTAWKAQGSPDGWPRNWRVFGAGDILSTAADLYRWECALDGAKVLPRRSVTSMRQPQFRIDDSVSFGYTLFISQSAEEGLLLEHGGDWIRGYNGNIFRLPEHGVLLIILSNSRDREGIWMRQSVQKELLEIVRGVTPASEIPPASPPAPADRLALPGEYDLGGGSRLAIFDDGAHLWIGGEGQAALGLLKEIPADRAEGLAEANRRTRALLAALLREEPGFVEALGEEGAPHAGGYQEEWSELLDGHGPLTGFRVLGSLPAGPAAKTWARLVLEEGEVEMNYFWREGGRGRLGGSYAVPPWQMQGMPAAYPFARSPEGGFVGYNPVREETIRFHAERGAAGSITGLVIETGDGGERRASRTACRSCPSMTAEEIR